MLIPLLWFAVFAGSLALGMSLLFVLKIRFDTPSERAIFGFALGLGVLSLLVTLLGFAGLLFPVVSTGVVVLLGVATLTISVWKRSTLIRIFRGKNVAVGLSPSRSVWLAVAGLLLLASVNLVGALAPPNFADALIADLAAAKSYVGWHQILFSPSAFQYPQGMGMIYALMLSLGAETVPGLINWGLGLMLAAAVYSICRNRFEVSNVAACWVTLAFYAMPLMIFESTVQKPDLLYALTGVLSVYAFLIWRSSGRGWSLLVISALMAGFSAAAKYQGLVIIACTGLLFALDMLIAGRRRLLPFLGSLGLFFAVAALVASPWYLRNWIATGNPVWPMLNQVFGGAYHMYLVPDSRISSSLVRLLRHVLLWPWDMFINQTTAYAVGTTDLISPLFLAFIPGLVLVRPAEPVRSRLGFLGIWCAVFLTVGPLVSVWLRHWMVAWPLLIPLVAIVVDKMWDNANRLVAWVTRGALLASIGFGLVVALVYARQFVPVVLGLQSRSAFLTQATGYYPDWEFANSRLTKTDKVLTVPPYVYYLNAETVQAHPLYGAQLDYASMTTPTDLKERLRGAAITYVLWDTHWWYERQYIEPGEHARISRLYETLIAERVFCPVYQRVARIPVHKTLGEFGGMVQSTVTLYRLEDEGQTCMPEEGLSR